MAREVYRFAVAVPAGTAKTSPASIACPMPPRQVTRVEVKVPPGPHGLVGFQLASGGVPMIPLPAGAFVVTDDEELGWDLEGQIDSGAWQVLAYNTGSFDHTLEVRFLCDLVVPAAGLLGPQPLPVDVLSG